MQVDDVSTEDSGPSLKQPDGNVMDTFRNQADSESGVAIIMALWILSLLVIIAATFSIGTRFSINSTESAMNLNRTRQIIRTGIESWSAQLRGDLILDDVGVQPTEILNHDPIGQDVRINEVKAQPLQDWTCDINPGTHMELVNVGESPIDIGGWFAAVSGGHPIPFSDYMVHHAGDNPNSGGSNGAPDIPDNTILCPLRGDGSCVSQGSNFVRFYAIGTPDANAYNKSKPLEIRLCDDDVPTDKFDCFNRHPSDLHVRDYVRFDFSCTGLLFGKQCGLTWQVFPDGWNGRKPVQRRNMTESPSAWSKAACTMDADNDGNVSRRHNDKHYDFPDGTNVTQYNGSGYWIKNGENQYDGLRLTNTDGSSGSSFDFGGDIEWSDLRKRGMFEGENGMLGDESDPSDIADAPFCEVIKQNDCPDGSACQESCNFKEKFFVETSEGAPGKAVITNGLTRESLVEVFPHADTMYKRDGYMHYIPVIPTGLIMKANRKGDSFPFFRNNDDHFIRAEVPKPRDATGDSAITWNSYGFFDQYADPLSSNLGSAPVMDSLSSGAGEHGWIVRMTRGQNPATSLRRSDSEVAEPDPGTARPAFYSGNAGDYQFNSNDDADSHLYVSESYHSSLSHNSHPNIDGHDNDCNLKVTSFRRDDSPNFIEIFNPGPESYVLGTVKETYFQSAAAGGGTWNEQTHFSGSRQLDPGEYYVLSETPSGGYPAANNIYDTQLHDYPNPMMLDQERDFGIRVLDGDDELCDKVGVDNRDGSHTAHQVGSDWFEGTRISYDDDRIVAFRLKSTAFPEDIPRDEGVNATDFHVSNPNTNSWQSAKDLNWRRADNLNDPPQNLKENYDFFGRSFVEVAQFGGPEREGEEGGEFVEIYNTGDTVDVTSDLEITDFRDAAGKHHAGGAGDSPYDLELHWLDPYSGSGDGELAPGQVGVIMRETDDLDTEEIGWRNQGLRKLINGHDIDNDGRGDTVRIYTTEQDGDTFLTGGIHNAIPEDIKITKSSGSERVLSSGSWDYTCTVSDHSCYKVRIDGEQSAKNWNNLSVRRGTPGEVRFIDHLDEEWGWGGRMILDSSSLPMDKPICVPSMTSCPNPQSNIPGSDVGYFEFVHIEDETGKINLVQPPVQDAFDTEATSLKIGDDGNFSTDDPDSQGRSFLGGWGTDSIVGNVVDFPDTNPTFWMSPGGMMSVEGIVPGSYGTVSNTMDDYQHVYTTMRSDTTNRRINVNTAAYEALKGIQVNPEGTDPTFMTDKMVAQIITTRSCNDSYQPGTPIPEEDYDCADNTPYITAEQVCQNLNSSPAVTNSVDCNVLSNTVTTSSGGIFRAEVRAVVMGDGEVKSEGLWEVFIDRTGAEKSSGTVDVVFVRELDKLSQ